MIRLAADGFQVPADGALPFPLGFAPERVGAGGGSIVRRNPVRFGEITNDARLQAHFARVAGEVEGGDRGERQLAPGPRILGIAGCAPAQNPDLAPLQMVLSEAAESILELFVRGMLPHPFVGAKGGGFRAVHGGDKIE